MCFCFVFFFVEKITDADIERVAQRLLATPPALAARGDIRGLPDNKDIHTGLLKDTQANGSTNRLLSLFR